MANINYGEVLCQAVDEIINKRLEGISYDKTIICTIISDDTKEQGIYRVSNNDLIEFNAYSSNTSYRKGDNVYVQIPGGDWNQQKIIIAKKTDKINEPFIYKKPFDSLVDITGNLIKTETKAALVANGDQESIILWTYNNYDVNALYNVEGPVLASYRRLGLQGSFQSLLKTFQIDGKTYKVNQGNYGLKLTIVSAENSVSLAQEKDGTYILYLNCADMNGNPYDFQSYYLQEKVFDISQVGKIKSMKLEFYQDKNSFSSSDGKLLPHTDFLNNSLEPNLFVNDAHIALGYDTSEFSEELVLAYTLDSTSYSRDEEHKEKTVEVRWIHQVDNNTFESVTLDDKIDYEIRWYRFQLGASSADEYSGVYWTKIDSGEKDFNISFTPDTALSEERIKAIIIYNNRAYRSNILVFQNKNEVVNKATIDAIQALNIYCIDETTDSGTQSSYGNYKIYSQNGSLIDNAEASKIRFWEPHFKSSTEDIENKSDILIEAEYIEWIIPVKNTMIIPVKNNMDYEAFEYNSLYTEENPNKFEDDAGEGFYWFEDNNDQRIHIRRNGINNQLNNNLNLQPYKIKSYYSQSYADNTIQCKALKENIVYSATKEHTFGPSGTMGSDCTFIIDFDGGNTAVTINDDQAIIVTARLYDYENNEIDISNYEILWSWKTSGGIELINRSVEENNKQEILWSKGTVLGESYNILQAELKGWGDIESLMAFLPIPIRSDKKYAYISGTTQIIYNSSGEVSEYFQNPYVMYDKTGKEINITNWNIKNGIEKEESFSPKIITNDKTGEKYLTPLSFYIENSCQKLCVMAIVDSSIVWSQPLLVMQNRYPSAMLNSWDGSLDVGEQDQGTILAPRLVAGKKEFNNTFSGVVLGDWKSTNSDSSLTQQTGIYGFAQGEQSYAFKEDGTAFLGKSGRGRIEFKGDSGIIKSPDNAGMSIDLDDGIITSENFTLAAGKINGNGSEFINITTGANNYPLQIGNNFYVAWDGTITAKAGTFTGTINAKDGELGNLKVTGILDGGTIKGATIASGDKFVVTSSGDLTAKSGYIGGWSIDESGLSHSNGARLYPTGELVMGSGIYSTTINSNGISMGESGVQINSNGIQIGTGTGATYIDSNGMMIQTISFYSLANGKPTAQRAGYIEYIASDYGEGSNGTYSYSGVGITSGNLSLKVTNGHIGARYGTNSYWVLDQRGFMASYGGNSGATLVLHNEDNNYGVLGYSAGNGIYSAYVKVNQNSVKIKGDSSTYITVSNNTVKISDESGSGSLCNLEVTGEIKGTIYAVLA